MIDRIVEYKHHAISRDQTLSHKCEQFFLNFHVKKYRFHQLEWNESRYSESQEKCPQRLSSLETSDQEIAISPSPSRK